MNVFHDVQGLNVCCGGQGLNVSKFRDFKRYIIAFDGDLLHEFYAKG